MRDIQFLSGFHSSSVLQLTHLYLSCHPLDVYQLCEILRPHEGHLFHNIRVFPFTHNAGIQRARTRSGVCATMPKACAKNRAVFGVRWNYLLDAFSASQSAKSAGIATKKELIESSAPFSNCLCTFENGKTTKF